jgi:hypothetical protein
MNPRSFDTLISSLKARKLLDDAISIDTQERAVTDVNRQTEPGTIRERLNHR